ncbi:MAG: hypothetical protein ACK5S5_12710 [Planctomycetota bacterium]|jgi:hypothetical protein
MRVRVVDQDTGEIVKGAEVLWMLGHGAAATGMNDDWEATYSRIGKAKRSDSAGLAVLDGQRTPAFPAKSNRPIAIARHYNLYGELWHFDHRSPEGIPELRVRADATLVVVAHSDCGSGAAGVPVTLTGRRWQASMPTLVQARSRSFTTDSSGQVRIRHWRAASGAWSSLPHGSTHVELPTFGQHVEVSDTPRGEQSVVFQLPATGSIDIDIRAATDLLTGSLVRLTQVNGPAWLLADVEHGMAAFPFVPLGSEWSISVEACGARLFQDRMRGPIAPGERVAKAVGISDKVLVTARLLTEHGDALADQQVLLERAGVRLQAATTRSDGTVLVSVDKGAVTAGGSLRWRTRNLWPDPRAGMSSVEIDLAPRATTTVACGDVHMASEPLLVTGRVVDERGQPWPLLHVAASRPAQLDYLEPEQLAPRSIGTTASTFEVRGPLLDSPISVAVTGDQWTERRDAQRGDEIVIVRARWGKLSAGVQSAPSTLQVALQRQDGRTHHASRRDAGGAGASQFVWDKLEPGSWTFTCRMPGQNHPIVTIADVRVQPGDNHDPRLAAIDLQGVESIVKVKLHGFTAVAPTGEAAGICWLREVGSAGAFAAIAINLVGSSVDIPVPQVPIEARICLRGYEPLPLQRLLPGSTVDVTVDLLSEVLVKFVGDDGSPCAIGLEARASRSLTSAGDHPPLANGTGIDADWDGIHEWLTIDDAGCARLAVTRSRLHDVVIAKRGPLRMTALTQWIGKPLLDLRSGTEPIPLIVSRDTPK